MCEPTTLAVASLAMGAIGTGLNAAGAMQRQQAEQAQLAWQRQVMDNNRQLAEMQARDAVERGRIAADRSRTRTASMLGAQTARLAAQGADLLGSELDILGDTAAAGAFDALTIENDAAREAWAHRNRAAEHAARARAPGPADPGLGIGASLLAGAGTVADKWYRFGAGSGPMAGWAGYTGGTPTSLIPNA